MYIFQCQQNFDFEGYDEMNSKCIVLYIYIDQLHTYSMFVVCIQNVIRIDDILIEFKIFIIVYDKLLQNQPEICVCI